MRASADAPASAGMAIRSPAIQSPAIRRTEVARNAAFCPGARATFWRMSPQGRPGAPEGRRPVRRPVAQEPASAVSSATFVPETGAMPTPAGLSAGGAVAAVADPHRSRPCLSSMRRRCSCGKEPVPPGPISPVWEQGSPPRRDPPERLFGTAGAEPARQGQALRSCRRPSSAATLRAAGSSWIDGNVLPSGATARIESTPGGVARRAASLVVFRATGGCAGPLIEALAGQERRP